MNIGVVFEDRNRLTAVSIILVILLFLSINVLSNQLLKTAQIDLTQDRLFTVSEATKDILGSLDEPITLRLYKSKKVSRVPSLASYAVRVEELLEHYERLAAGRIILQVYEPEQFSVEEDQAVGFGIQAVPISGAGDVIYFGLAGTNSTDDEDVIPLFTPERESFLEYDLSKLVYNLSLPRKTTVAMISTLPLAADPQRGYEPWVAYQQAMQFFDMRILGGNTKKIDNQTDILLLIQPTSLSDTTLYAIDQFVMRGGKLLAFIDPHVEVKPPPRQEPGQPYRPPPSHAIGRLLDAWGVEMPVDRVLGDRMAAQRVAALSGGRRVVTEYLPWLSIGQFGMNPMDVVTSEIERVNLISSGYLKLSEGSKLKIEPLIYTSEQSQLLAIDRVRPNPNPVEILASFEAEKRSFPIAARFTGVVKTAFPEGPPDQEDDRTAVGPDPELVKVHRDLSDDQAVMIIVADADLLADQIWMRGGGGTLAVPIAQNGDFFVNTLDNLAGSTGLIALRGRGLSNRPFTMVDEIRRNSELQYRTKERELLQKLKETERNIARLRTEDEGQAILSEDQQKAISEFRRDMVRTRAELRKVQHALQEDIETLDARLKLINIGVIPLLIAFFALVLALVRRIRFSRRIRSQRGEVAVTGGRLS